MLGNLCSMQPRHQLNLETWLLLDNRGSSFQVFKYISQPNKKVKEISAAGGMQSNRR
jgi:hypothetical protein